MACCMRKYYPARVMAKPAPDRYLIEYFDGTRDKITRKRFYTQFQPQFKTCTMGAIQLIGDMPASMAGVAVEQEIDLERDLERDIG
ncbi:hypothetical protein GGI21_006522, partial [Coemansia aciculifera]